MGHPYCLPVKEIKFYLENTSFNACTIFHIQYLKLRKLITRPIKRQDQITENKETEKGNQQNNRNRSKTFKIGTLE